MTDSPNQTKPTSLYSHLMKQPVEELSRMLTGLGLDPSSYPNKPAMASRLAKLGAQLAEDPPAESDAESDAEDVGAAPRVAICHGVIHGKPCGKTLTDDWCVVFYTADGITDPATLTEDYLYEQSYCSGCAMRMLQRHEIAGIRAVRREQ